MKRTALLALVLGLACVVGWAAHCPHCREEIRPGGKFCENCGAKLTSPAKPQTRPTTGPSTRPTTAPSTRPTTRRARPPAIPEDLDRRVQEAIEKAVKYLWSVRKPDGTWPPAELLIVAGKEADPGTKQSRGDHKKPFARMPFPVGTTALACFALLESGVSTQDERMAQSLRWLARQRTSKTYSLGVRANAWQAAARQEARYLNNLRHDLYTLTKGARGGAYSYDCFAGPTPRLARPRVSMPGVDSSQGHVARLKMNNGRIVTVPMPPDNSNSQYGLLGVWAGAKARVPTIPKMYWHAVNRYWMLAQNPDGGWGYLGGDRSRSYPSMTVAGLASLHVCNENLQADRFVQCGVNADVPAIAKGMVWLERHIEKMGLDALRHQGGKAFRNPLDLYYLFSVERVALASGYKYLGKLDWYKTGAARILRGQRRDGQVPSGGWGKPHIGTAFALLYLVRGRHPVVFNKLRFDSDWNNRPRDMASLTRWLSTTFERTVNWQIIRLADPVEDWHDAPILYVSGAEDPRFTDEHIGRLRTFVQQGGAIFSVTECSGRGFRSGIRQAYRKMFAGYGLQPLDAGHELFSTHFKVRGLHFSMISNGVRPLAIHCDYDLPLSWQQQHHLTRKWTFQVAANVVMYVTGKEAFRPRGASHWPKAPRLRPTRTAKLARLKHAGNFDPEPLAYERLRRLLGRRERIRLDVLAPVAIGDLPRSGAKLAALTGTGKLQLGDEDRRVLKEFVEGGGTLVIDAAGGDEEFHDSARAILREMYGPKLRTLATVSDVLGLKGREIRKVRYRGRAAMRLGRTGPPSLRAVLFDGRAGLIYSREDITGALVGCDSATCSGYAPDSAYQIMRNIVRLTAK